LFFNDRNIGCKEQVIEWLKSDEGKVWIQMQIRTVLEEMGSEMEKTG